MRNIKLTLEYDGSRFFGFQRQKVKPTLQAALEKALSRLFNRPMKIAAAAGRTDSGVHAKGQVVNFKTDSPLSLERIQKGLNAFLPKAIAVTKAEEAPPGFHARYSARWKTYEYLVFNSEIRSPLLSGRVYRFPYPLDYKIMKQAARKLVGRHDFKSFQAAGSSVCDTVRTIRRFTISVVPSPLRLRSGQAPPSPQRGEGKSRAVLLSSPLPLQGKKVRVRGELIRFSIEADGFLYRMVRNIVGTLLEAGRGRLSLKDFSRLLKKPHRPRATVPAQGLTLQAVEYEG